MDRSTYMLGFLLMVAGGFLLIYSAITGGFGSRLQESLGWNLFFAGLTIGVIGVVVPTEMIRSAWIAMGIALFSTVMFLVLTTIVAYVSARLRGYGVGFDFLEVSKFSSIVWLLLTILTIVIMVLRKRQ